MRTVDNYFKTEIVRSLYHYTSSDAMMGMVESGQLYATHAYFLNDAQEMKEAVDALELAIEGARSRISERNTRDFLDQFRNWLGAFRGLPFHIYVASFSEERNLLSQWRSYTRHGRGVNLEFSPERLAVPLAQPGYHIAKCLYLPVEHQKLAGSLIEKMLVTFRQSESPQQAGAPVDQRYHMFLEGFRGDIGRVLAIFKNRAFEEEKEWRIVSPYFAKYTVDDICYRSGPFALTPYIKMPLKRPDETRPKLFKSVGVGPSPESNLASQAVSNFLSRTGASNTTWYCGIPYRGPAA